MSVSGNTAMIVDPVEQERCIARSNAKLINLTASSENLVEVIEDVIRDGRAHGLVYKLRIHTRFVIPARSNRNNLGLIPNNAHHIGNGCFGVKGSGFSFNEIQNNALCAELQSEGEIVETVDRYKELVALSDGLLAPIETLQPKFASSGGSHMTAFCNATLAGCRTPFENIADRVGNIDQQRLRTKSPNFASALDEGWEWDVVTAKFNAALPRLMVLAQEAKNAPMQLGTSEGELQMMLKAIEEGNRRQEVGNVDWADVAKAAARSKSPCGPYMVTCVKYARLFGGGKEAPFLKEIDEYIKVCGYGGRSLGGAFLGKLTDLPIGGGDVACVQFRKGVFKYMVSDTDNVVGGMCAGAKDTDLARLLAHDQEVKAADLMMSKARTVAQQFGLARAAEVQMLGVLDVRIVALVWGRKALDRRTFASISDVADTFVTEANKKQKLAIVSPWAEDAKADRLAESLKAKPAKKQKAAPAAKTILERDAAGNLADPSAPLKERGFSVGADIVCKADSSTWTLKSFAATCVEVAPRSRAHVPTASGAGAGAEISEAEAVDAEAVDAEAVGDTAEENAAAEVATTNIVKVPYDEFAAKYKLGVSADIEIVANWREFDPTQMISLQIMRTKGWVADALVKLWDHYCTDPAYDHLIVGAKPKRVTTSVAIEVGAITLVPLTYNITVLDEADVKKVVFPSWNLGALIEDPKRKAFVLSSAVEIKDKSFVNPWWFVTTTADDRDSNVEIQCRKAGSLVNGIASSVGRDLMVPTLTNTKVVKKGGALVLYVPKGASAPVAAPTPSDTHAAAAPAQKRTAARGAGTPAKRGRGGRGRGL